MNLGWKDFYIIITLYIIGILAMFTIIDLTIEKEGTVGVSNALSFIGAILGGTISGVLTLLGVRLTIKEQRRMMSQEKIDKAQFIYESIEGDIKILNIAIEDLRIREDDDDGEILEQIIKKVESLCSIINEHSKILYETEYEFIKGILAIRSDVESINEFFELGGPNGMDWISNLVVYNKYIQSNFKYLKDNYFSKYK